jgi:predicted dinucleotide-binding enzyme
MGSALGRSFAAAGHAVTFSYSRDPAKLARLAKHSGPRARVAAPWDAVRKAEVVLLAVHWSQVPAALRAAGALRGKILIDVTNPMTSADDALAVGHRLSGGEIIAKRAHGAHYVKAFNTVPSELLAAGAGTLPERAAVCYCGDDLKARRVAARLIKQIGFEPVDCGALQSARYLEPLALLVAELAYNQGHRPEVGMRFVRRGKRKR